MKPALGNLDPLIFSRAALNPVDQTMFPRNPPGPPPGKLPLQWFRLPYPLKRMPPYILDQGINLPKNSMI
ncbi:hypothetical protein AA11826_1791 [Komagataeibacter oboediens DSM 11826]|uniref:Uncharacterized protein n=1 Tax=Novacetimonas maltaceti TaxID=1203393 RepID=A0A2S3VX53_9PROT|nr:hypothetical protein KMAL_31660 [Novacetimonas maltaceti]GBR38221.1 hypothetical protein AA11826_1791 [Komagataeibacter oboediens DSM 11826]